jgi:hypothetical protein
MKKKHCLNFIKTPLIALALTSGTALAGTEMAPAPAPAVAPEEDVISATLSLAANSHFISYGKDVWADGSSMSRPGFNPMLEFAFKLPENFTLTLGTWWDVTAKGDGVATPYTLGGDVYEIDLWAGLSYTYEKFTIGATYQAWMYGDAVEGIVDVKLAYDTFLSPTLTFHNRVSEGASGGDTGTIAVLGLSYSIEAGPVTFSVPFNIAANLTDDYNRLNTFGGSDTGYAYCSLGLQATYPLAFLGSTYGEWAVTGGIVQYWTEAEVLPKNPKNQFLTYNVGLTASF